MTWISLVQRSLGLSLITIAIAAGLLSPPPAQASHVAKVINPEPKLKSPVKAPVSKRSLSVKFIPPPLPSWGAPGRRKDAASRGRCPSSAQPLTALVPVTPSPETAGLSLKRQAGTLVMAAGESVWGLTAAPRPSFWFYVPYLSAGYPGEFVLQDEQNETIYQAPFTAAGTSAGVVHFQLPPTAKPLEVGKRYHWYFLINCDRGYPAFVEGWVQRVALSPALVSQLKTATPQERIELYGAQGLWYDTLTALVELDPLNPQDTPSSQVWQDLLQAIDLGDIASAPVVQCCQPESQGSTAD